MGQEIRAVFLSGGVAWSGRNEHAFAAVAVRVRTVIEAT